MKWIKKHIVLTVASLVVTFYWILAFRLILENPELTGLVIYDYGKSTVIIIVVALIIKYSIKIVRKAIHR